MKNISAWAIRHPITPIVLFVVLTFIGSVAFIGLPISLMPDVSAPFVNVTVSQPGAAPTEIETQITRRVEGAVANVGNVKNLISWTVEGQTTTTVEFHIGTPVDRAVNDIRDAVGKIRGNLPQDILEPVIQRLETDGGPIAYFTASTTGMAPEELSWFIDNAVTKRLLSLPGVSQVTRGGGVDREIRVELDPARMQALGITAVEVNQQLRQLNIDVGGGRAEVAGGEQSIRVLGGARTAAQLGTAHIVLPGGRVARLTDIADVRDGTAEIRTLSRLNGRPALTFAVFKAKGASDVSLLDSVHAELGKIGAESPQVQLKQVYTTVDHTKRIYHTAINALIEGSILAVIVVFFFLRDWRATAISALAIPLSAIPTFGFMYAMDFTLNEISLLALSLVAGVLVDDAIVEIENIVRHMHMGKSPFQAALDAADEIGLAVVATSATIIAVFLPVSFMSGITGQFFKQFGLTVAVAVFMSLVVARLVTPLIAAYTLRPDKHPAQMGREVHVGSPTLGKGHAAGDGPVMTWYLHSLAFCVHNRGKTLLGGTAVFLVSVIGLVLIPKAFIPPADTATSVLSIELPPGVQLEQTSRTSALAAAIVRRSPEVTDVVESVGADDEGDVRSSTLYISLVPHDNRRLSQQQWEAKVIEELRQVPDARIHFVSQANGLGRDVTIFVAGEDSALVQRTAEQAVAEMRRLPQLRDPGINGDLRRPEILIRPRLDLAAELGVTVADISQTVRIATLGDLPQNVAKLSLSDRQVPIRVSLIESARRDLATLENLPVPTAAGGTVPLKTVADISFGRGPTKVRRYNQLRRLALEADLNGVQLGDALKLIYNLPALKHMPQGVRLVEIGDAEAMRELFDNFLVAVVTGVLMVFAVLVLLFARVFQPITILSALPLSLAGAVIALVLSGYPLSLPAVIGILMLMGIVAKNSILLVDFAIEEMRAGKDRMTALLESGHKRARPIVMTTVAMIAGMLPAALGLGGDSFRGAMAMAVIGGLITSTALTLVVVPAVFTLIDDLERWLAPKAARLLSTHSTPNPTPNPRTSKPSSAG